MKNSARLFGAYRDAESFDSEWRETAARGGGRESIAGYSVQGRPLRVFEFGAPEQPAILLTALIHGVEVIGSVALLHVINELAADGQSQALLSAFRLVVMPVVNPDAFARNMDRLQRGWPAMQRKNARGVDLNRNFPSPAPAQRRSWHPFSGSSLRFSPYYRGPAPFSEPETQAVREVVAASKPVISIGFHSFGNVLLYPWAFSRTPNGKIDSYRQMARAFVSGLGNQSYGLKQASAFYPTVGDLDDWLDADYGTLAMTVEVGGLDRRLLSPARFFNPFSWMNPVDIAGTVGNLSPGVRGLLHASSQIVTQPTSACR